MDIMHLRCNPTFKGEQAPFGPPSSADNISSWALCGRLTLTPEHWVPEGSQLAFSEFTGMFHCLMLVCCQVGFEAAVWPVPSEEASTFHLHIVKLLTIITIQV